MTHVWPPFITGYPSIIWTLYGRLGIISSFHHQRDLQHLFWLLSPLQLRRCNCNDAPAISLTPSTFSHFVRSTWTPLLQCTSMQKMLSWWSGGRQENGGEELLQLVPSGQIESPDCIAPEVTLIRYREAFVRSSTSIPPQVVECRAGLVNWKAVTTRWLLRKKSETRTDTMESLVSDI